MNERPAIWWEPMSIPDEVRFYAERDGAIWVQDKVSGKKYMIVAEARFVPAWPPAEHPSHPTCKTRRTKNGGGDELEFRVGEPTT